MSAPGFAGNSYILDIPADSGAFLAVVAKSVVRQLLIQESQITAEGAANVPQGVIDYQIPNDGTLNGFTTVFRAVQGAGAPQGLPIQLGSTIEQRGPYGEIIGQPPQPIVGLPGVNNLTTQIPMIKLRSGTATGTSVVITELN